MAHECPECGSTCFCDCDDTWDDSKAAALRCRHHCEPEPEDGDFIEDEEGTRGT